jgi:hypothetical protein
MKEASIGNKGSSILEGMIALAVLTLAISAAVLVAFANQILSVDGSTSYEALGKARELLENASTRSQTNFGDVITQPSVLDSIYTKQLLVNDITPCVKEATSRITWATQPNRPLFVELTSTISNIFGATAIGNDCPTDGPSSTWANPQQFSTSNLPGTATAIDVLNGIAYIGKTLEPYFAIAENGNFITFTNTFSLGADPNALDAIQWRDSGTNDLKIYLFAAMNTPTNQLKIIDATDRFNPVVVSTLSLSSCVGNSFPQGWRLSYYKDRLYLVTRETAGPEFHVFDVATPSNPVELGSGTCKGAELNTTVNGIAIRDQIIAGNLRRFLYMATTNDTGEIRVFEATDPTNIGAITEITLARQNLSGIQNGLVVYLIGNKLFFGRQSAPSGPDLYVYDIQNTVSGLTLLGSQDISTGVTSIRIAGNFAFLGTPRVNREFQVWNIADLSRITLVQTYTFANIIENGIDYEPDVIYAAGTSEALRLIHSP